MKLKLVAGLVVVIVAGWAGGTFYTGSQLKTRLPELVAKANTNLKRSNIPVVLSLENVQSGFLNTTADLILKSNDTSLVTFSAKAAHGPLPNFSGFGMAQVTATATNIDGLKKMMGLKTEKIDAILNSSISFSGASSTTVDVSPLKETIFANELETAAIKITLNSVDSTKFDTNVQSAKILVKQPSMMNEGKFNELTLENIVMTVAQSPSQTQLPDTKSGIEIGKLNVVNVDNAQYSTSIADVKFNTALTSKDNTFAVNYTGSTGDVALSGNNLGKLAFDMSLENLATDIFAKDHNSFTALSDSMNILAQNIMQNDQETLASNPVVNIKKIELANTAGSSTFNANVSFQAPNTEATNILGSLPFKSANLSLINDKPFVQSIIEQVLIVDGTSAEEAKKQAPENMSQLIGMGQMFDLIVVAEDKIKLELSIENGKVMLNSKELTEQQIQQMFGMFMGGGF